VRTASDWLAILLKCHVKAATALAWSQVFADTIRDGTFSAGDKDLAPFLAQMLHETGGLEQLTENLTYSAARILAVWPSRFSSLADAQPYANNPQALAEKVYWGRMGNINHGDGWAYRGRGMPQITGRANYAMVGNLVGQDLQSVPDLLAQPHYALEAGVAWWECKIPDSMLADTVAVTRIVNGGTIGLAQRQTLTTQALSAINTGATA